MEKKQIKQELKKYEKYLNREAKRFKLTSNDLSNLYDLMYMMDMGMTGADRKTLELNKMDKWFDEFWARLDKIVLNEKY